MPHHRVTVVGSFAVGLCLRSERFPVSGETVLGRDFDEGPGGKGSNQAVQVARARTGVEFVGVVGTDAYGDLGARLFADEGVGTRHLKRTADRNTGVGFILLDAAGDNRIVLDPGANALFSPDDVAAARATIATGGVVLTQLEIPEATASAALRVGRDSGVTTLLNPAPVRPLPPEVLALADVLTPNQTEARVLLGLAPDDAAHDLDICARLLDLGVATVVLTRGADGAVIATSEGAAAVPAPAVEVVDSTGAGDAFSGTLAAELSAGRGLEDAVQRAVCAGALACTRLGVIPSLPRADELDRFMSTGAPT